MAGPEFGASPNPSKSEFLRDAQSPGPRAPLLGFPRGAHLAAARPGLAPGLSSSFSSSSLSREGLRAAKNRDRLCQEAPPRRRPPDIAPPAGARLPGAPESAAGTDRRPEQTPRAEDRLQSVSRSVGRKVNQSERLSDRKSDRQSDCQTVSPSIRPGERTTRLKSICQSDHSRRERRWLPAQGSWLRPPPPMATPRGGVCVALATPWQGSSLCCYDHAQEWSAPATPRGRSIFLPRPQPCPVPRQSWLGGWLVGVWGRMDGGVLSLKCRLLTPGFPPKQVPAAAAFLSLCAPFFSPFRFLLLICFFLLCRPLSRNK